MTQSKFFEKLMKSMFFCTGWFLFSFVFSAIWFGIWCSHLNDDLWFEIAGHQLSIISMVVWVSAALTLISLIVVLALLYFLGDKHILHYVTASIALIALLAEIAAICASLAKTTRTECRKIRTEFTTHIESSSPSRNIINFMTKNNCNSSSSCKSSCDKFVDRRCKLGFSLNLTLFVFQIIPFIGLIVTLILMSTL